MSEELPPPTPKTAAIPPPKTSAVPLKKETVRITLRARPGSGTTQPRESTSPVPTAATGSVPPSADKRATAPIQLPSSPLPPPSPKSATNPISLPPAPVPPPGRGAMPMAPSAPGAPSAPPAPTGGAPRPPAAAPRPMAPGGGAPTAPRPMAPGAPRVETGAATQPLAGKPPMAAPRPPGGGTAPLVGGAPGGGLPKATQKLQVTQPMARPAVAPAPPSAPVKRSAAADSQQFYEEKDPEAGLVPLSVICFVLSLVLMAVQVLSTDRMFSAAPGEESPFMVPQYQNVSWETRNVEDGSVISKFSTVLPELPQ